MQEIRISDFHLIRLGYGYGDIGRDALEDVYAFVFKTEKPLLDLKLFLVSCNCTSSLWLIETG